MGDVANDKGNAAGLDWPLIGRVLGRHAVTEE